MSTPLYSYNYDYDYDYDYDYNYNTDIEIKIGITINVQIIYPSGMMQFFTVVKNNSDSIIELETNNLESFYLSLFQHTDYCYVPLNFPYDKLGDKFSSCWNKSLKVLREDAQKWYLLSLYNMNYDLDTISEGINVKLDTGENIVITYFESIAIYGKAIKTESSSIEYELSSEPEKLFDYTKDIYILICHISCSNATVCPIRIKTDCLSD